MLCDEDGVPVALTVSYVALDGSERVPPLPRSADPVAFLEDELGVVLGPSTTTVGAMSADAATAEQLAVPEGAAMLWFEDVLTDDSGQPRALSQYRLRGDRIATSATVHRRGTSHPGVVASTARPDL
jgi:GntR family transcriptional regulator